MLRFLCLVMLLLSIALPATAWERAGAARLLVNDALGDRHDRWRTGSWQAGQLLQPGPADSGPDLVELRVFAQILAPWSLRKPAPGDRLLAGAISLGAHGYWIGQTVDLHLGVDIVGTGPATGLGDLLDWLHDGDQSPSPEVIEAQVGNALIPSLRASAGRSIVLASGVVLRPFAEARVGVETYLRAGVDLTLGPAGDALLPVREEVTGFLLASTRATDRGVALILGADAARVLASRYLPDRGPEIEPVRLRVRAGGLWRSDRAQAFYGLTWLGEEFEGQPEGQVVGALHLNIRF